VQCSRAVYVNVVLCDSGRRFSRSPEPWSARSVCRLAALSQCHGNATARSASDVERREAVSCRQTARHRHSPGTLRQGLDGCSELLKTIPKTTENLYKKLLRTLSDPRGGILTLTDPRRGQFFLKISLETITTRSFLL